MLREPLIPDNLRLAIEGDTLSGVHSQTHDLQRRTLGTIVIMGTVMALAACSSSGAPTSSSTSRSGVITTLPGNETCTGRPPENSGSPDFYRQQYADGVAAPLKEKLKTYDSAVVSGDSHLIGQAAAALGTDFRTDATLVDIPRLYGCYDQQILAHLQKAAVAFADTLDGMSCAADGMCGKKQTDVPALIAQAAPQERAAVDAFNAYAAQFGAEKLPTQTASAVPRAWRL
jgi:hypothetical protein